VYVNNVLGCVGISLLTFALFMSARMGIYQDTVYARYGKHPSEALFYNVIKSTAVTHCTAHNFSNVNLNDCLIDCCCCLLVLYDLLRQ